jgi:putative transposase
VIDLLRKSNRLRNYDYSQGGVYFITICTKDRGNLLWDMKAMEEGFLSEAGKITELEIKKIETCYSNVIIDKYTVMPNHVHIIIILNNTREKSIPNISRIVQQFKGSISKQVGFSVWQKSFHDHIIRCEKEYLKIWEYINENWLNWHKDCYYKM